MDLRRYSPSGLQIMAAIRTLNYQPFIISDDVQTGVAYSWLHSADPRDDDGPDRFVFRRAKLHTDVWEKADDANARLRAMYDDFVGEIARRYPGGSLLDVACNNGYFPVRAEQLGMRSCAGMDFLPHWAAIKVLNNITGTSVKFVNQQYSSVEHKANVRKRYDVVVASAIMCHLPDPLNFLAFLGSVANEAVFFWGQMIDSDDFLVGYNEPNRFNERPFPHGFDDNTRLSRGLFRKSAELMGFGNIVELPHRDAWLPARWYAPHRAWLCMRK